jgi:hypothetical protein
MKAIMSQKLRNILNHPQDAREFQKQLSNSPKLEKYEEQRRNLRSKTRAHAIKK